MKLSSHKLQRGSARIELSMTSMIDVVFLLLIFFLVTTTFVNAERQLKPAIQVQEQTESAASEGFLEPAVVRVTQRNGRDVYLLGSRELLTVEELIPVLEAFDNKDDGAFVLVDDEVSFEMTAGAIQACRSAGFLQVSYVPAKTDG